MYRRCRNAGCQVVQRRLAQQAGAAREVQDVIHELWAARRRFMMQEKTIDGR